jgi:hypothetical protein
MQKKIDNILHLFMITLSILRKEGDPILKGGDEK